LFVSNPANFTTLGIAVKKPFVPTESYVFFLARGWALSVLVFAMIRLYNSIWLTSGGGSTLPYSLVFSPLLSMETADPYLPSSDASSLMIFCLFVGLKVLAYSSYGTSN